MKAYVHILYIGMISFIIKAAFSMRSKLRLEKYLIRTHQPGIKNCK